MSVILGDKKQSCSRNNKFPAEDPKASSRRLEEEMVNGPVTITTTSGLAIGVTGAASRNPRRRYLPRPCSAARSGPPPRRWGAWRRSRPATGPRSGRTASRWTSPTGPWAPPRRRGPTRPHPPSHRCCWLGRRCGASRTASRTRPATLPRPPRGWLSPRACRQASQARDWGECSVRR